jgi:integrase
VAVLDRMPCVVRLLKVSQSKFDFYDFAEFETFLAAAAALRPQAHLIALLGGEVGLRSGEMRALKWTDIDFGKRRMCVSKSVWRGQVGLPKGNRIRHVPLTPLAATALQAYRHLRGPLVLYRKDVSPMPEYTLRDLLLRVGRIANLRHSGSDRI